MTTEFLKNISGFLKIDAVSIDNNVFRLHYKVTGILLVALSLLVTEKQYIGDPIDCITDKIPPKLMDTYCWIHSTYTVRNLSNAVVGVDVPHPGVAPPFDDYERHYHKYYQWVTFVLFFQAMMFYMPRYVWKLWEGNKMKHLVMQLNLPLLDDQVRGSRRLFLVDYYLKSLHDHDDYAYRFFFCEILNLVNVIGQIFITDAFLSHEFTTYGSRVVEFSNLEIGTRIDPMDEVFPKVTKCTFHRYGPTGTVERVDALCVLPINVLNEKIYIILWFWFIILAVISGLHMFYRLATFSPKFRLKLLKSRATLADPTQIEGICNSSNVGDWFILYQLAKNLDSMVYAEIVDNLSEEMKKRFSTDLNDDGLGRDSASTLPSKATLD